MNWKFQKGKGKLHCLIIENLILSLFHPLAIDARNDFVSLVYTVLCINIYKVILTSLCLRQ